MLSLVNVIIEEDFNLFNSDIILNSELIVDNQNSPLEIFENVIQNNSDISGYITPKEDNIFIMHIKCIDGYFPDKGSHIIRIEVKDENSFNLLCHYGGLM